MNNQIIFKQKNWDDIIKSLYQTKELESAVYGFYKESITTASHKILVNDILIPQPSDFHTQNPARVAFTPEFTNQAFLRCQKDQYHLLDIHTHPWSPEVDFSSIDDHEAIRTKIPYLKRYLKGVKISFIVLGKNSAIAQARRWAPRTDNLLTINKIVII